MTNRPQPAADAPSPPSIVPRCKQPADEPAAGRGPGDRGQGVHGELLQHDARVPQDRAEADEEQGEPDRHRTVFPSQM